ncbi:hypothetical protein 2016DhaA_0365 [Vibrio phage ICP1]|uniref:Uncharacterized protein ORF77 n=1 Tax=Vibrio phage ICP1 TaxID=979525 RepID=F1D199_9CAUD|nr:hypothetical protein ViPhICP1_gp077 [Vibrio phage ICP1]ADX88120.1 hypothetical protein TUST1-191_00370 [Vibrio phage ICP1_2006_D]ADX88347.1 hypothetical protein TUST1-182_00370 [Vibrio phage ICP1_2006_C]ADX89258.1 hypothetical protein TUST1-2_00380 [Vibrio phage ICP1_2001_A]ADX89485.1 hypothetical protein TUST1-10_00365 [Vibrio phage ICP1_2004_A]APD17836.1 hypothetical protein [Vibrio phage JSF4]ASV41386.1 hypothetical protein [Vibrio phage JSF5]ASV41621.1 hypothetical protein [Vibrio pha
MATNIRVDGDIYNQTRDFTFDGVVYILNIRWNDSALIRGANNSGWMVTLADKDLYQQEGLSENSIILASQKLMHNQNIFENFYYLNIPTGALVAFDTEGNGDKEVTKYNFGEERRYQLKYFSKTEFDELNQELFGVS